MTGVSFWSRGADGVAAVRSRAHWDHTVPDRLRRCGTLLLVLAPWPGLEAGARAPPLGVPAPLRRAHCLAEVGTALDCGCIVRPLLAPAAAAALAPRLRTQLAEIGTQLAAIALDATWLLPAADNAHIVNAIGERSGGARALGAAVQDALHSWLVAMGRAALAQSSSDLELMAQLAQLLALPRVVDVRPCAPRAPAAADPERATVRRRWRFDGDEGDDGARAPDGVALAEAETLLRRALAGRETMDALHADTLNLVHELGCVLEARGELEEAEQLLKRAVDGREAALGDTHAHTLASVRALARLTAKLDDGEEAQAMYRRALAGFEHALGLTHGTTLSTCVEFALLLRSEGDSSDAEAMLRRAAAGYEHALGDAHLTTLRALERLGEQVEDEDEPDEAIALYTRALDGYARLLGPAHARCARVAERLGAMLDAAGAHEEAEQVRAGVHATPADARGAQELGGAPRVQRAASGSHLL